MIRKIVSMLSIVVALAFGALAAVNSKPVSLVVKPDCCQNACAGLEGHAYEYCYSQCIHDTTGGPCCTACPEPKPSATNIPRKRD